jgi:hypothetical protein
MSLYNQMCGNNPLFGIYARVLETVAPIAPVPRFRDMYTREVYGKPQIVIYTRTGGSNREGYKSENSELSNHPLFAGDFDDDFDSTFAHFAFNVPDAFSERMLRLHRAFSIYPNGMTPRQKFEQSMANLKGDPVQEVDADDSDMDELQQAIDAIVRDLPNEPSTIEAAVQA